MTVQKCFVADRRTLEAHSDPFKLVMIDCELFHFMIWYYNEKQINWNLSFPLPVNKVVITTEAENTGYTQIWTP